MSEISRDFLKIISKRNKKILSVVHQISSPKQPVFCFIFRLVCALVHNCSKETVPLSLDLLQPLLEPWLYEKWQPIREPEESITFNNWNRDFFSNYFRVKNLVQKCLQKSYNIKLHLTCWNSIRSVWTLILRKTYSVTLIIYLWW